MKPQYPATTKKENTPSSTLWRKISKVDKIIQLKQSQFSNQRFKTSLELQLQAPSLYDQQSQSAKLYRTPSKNPQKFPQKDPQKFEESFINPLSGQLIKLSHSTYRINTTDEIQQVRPATICPGCMPQYQQTVENFRDQMQMLSLDYRIFREQIQVEVRDVMQWAGDFVRGYCERMGKQDGRWQITRQEDLLTKISKNPSPLHLKLQEVQQELTKWKKTANEQQNQLNQLRSGIKILQNIKKKLNFQLNIQSHLPNTPKSHKPMFQSPKLQKKDTLSQREPEEARSSQNSSDQIDQLRGSNKPLNKSIEIEKIKKKIMGLKQKLSMTTSLKH